MKEREIKRYVRIMIGLISMIITGIGFAILLKMEGYIVLGMLGTLPVLYHAITILSEIR